MFLHTFSLYPVCRKVGVGARMSSNFFIYAPMIIILHYEVCCWGERTWPTHDPPLCACHLQHNTRPNEKVLYTHTHVLWAIRTEVKYSHSKAFTSPAFDSLQHVRTTSNQKLEPGKVWEQGWSCLHWSVMQKRQNLTHYLLGIRLIHY